MVKYKWNLGMGGFWGLVALQKKFHADLNGKKTQIYNKSHPRNSAGQALPPFKGESHLLAHLK